MNILLVEDDPDMSNALLRALVRRGIIVFPCFEGTSALSLIKSDKYDLVILDLSIPGIDGLHLLQRVRSQGIETPIIILTARGSVGDRIVGLNTGADDYITKPFDLEELEARIMGKKWGEAHLNGLMPPKKNSLSVTFINSMHYSKYRVLKIDAYSA